MLNRRRFLVSGLLSAGLVALCGALYEARPDPAPADPAFRFTMLDEEDRAIVAVLAEPLIGRAGVAEATVRGLDVAIRGLPLEVRAQVRQLFGLLRFAPTRMLVAGIVQPWRDASPAAVDRFLRSWRESSFVQLRTAYDALHQLILAAWYGNDAAWEAIGYPGPPVVTR